MLTRNVSPMIQAGVVLSSTKKPPIHIPLESCVNTKSAGLILQVLPPNDMVTFTEVVQARRLNYFP